VKEIRWQVGGYTQTGEELRWRPDRKGMYQAIVIATDHAGNTGRTEFMIEVRGEEIDNDDDVIITPIEDDDDNSGFICVTFLIIIAIAILIVWSVTRSAKKENRDGEKIKSLYVPSVPEKSSDNTILAGEKGEPSSKGEGGPAPWEGGDEKEIALQGPDHEDDDEEIEKFTRAYDLKMHTEGDERPLSGPRIAPLPPGWEE
jgi:hypothetical protein